MRLSWPLGRATTVLVVAVAALGALDLALGAARERTRRAEAELVRLVPVRVFELAEVERLDLTLGDGSGTWTYLKRSGAHRIPRYRDAYALSPSVESIEKALVEGRGTRAARFPAAAERYGLSPRTAMKLELRDRDGYLLLEALAGRVAPGERGDECYVAQAEGESVLLLNANPWSPLALAGDGHLPPLIDTRVVPGALQRASIARIGVTPTPSGLAELTRREIPRDPESREPDRGPRFEWTASFLEGGERRVNDVAAGRYAAFVAGLSFDDLVGPASTERARAGAPVLTLVLHYDGGAEDTLTLGSRTPDGRHFLHSTATDQVFLLGSGDAAQLLPDVGALLAPMPKREERDG